jgi:hypothetical protein
MFKCVRYETNKIHAIILAEKLGNLFAIVGELSSGPMIFDTILSPHARDGRGRGARLGAGN